jgi:hypothetical protein
MLKILLPIIFPSWRFFSGIDPSPRVDIGFLKAGESDPEEWIDMSVLPQRLGFWEGVGRLFHNPVWNDRLYINTCAEHLYEFNSEFREEEVANRVVRLFQGCGYSIPDAAETFCFRIRVVTAGTLDANGKSIFFSGAFLLSDYVT